MANLDRARLGDRASVHVADLAQPLAMFADASFDVVAASLVLHYLERWEPTLREFMRAFLRQAAPSGGYAAVGGVTPARLSSRARWQRTKRPGPASSQAGL